MRARRGFSLSELLVLIAFLLLVGGLILAAVSSARFKSGQVQCQNNLKQIVLAVHNCNDTYGRLPPGIGTFPPTTAEIPTNFGNALFFFLPFLEANTIYKNSAGTIGITPGSANKKFARDADPPGEGAPGNWAGFNSQFSIPLKIFQCPADPSNPVQGFVADGTLAEYIGSTSVDAKGGTGYFTNWGVCSYALNAQVFMVCDQNPADAGPAGFPQGVFGGAGKTAGGKYGENSGKADKPLGYGYFNADSGMLKALDGEAQLAKSFPDGLSNTILVCERYARCTSEAAALAQPFHVGGNYWAYDGVDKADGKAPSIVFGFNAGINKPTDASGWLPASYTAAKKPEPTPVFPFFAWNLWDGPGTSFYKAGNLISIGPASKPLFKPTPFAGRESQCDPRLPSTPHDAMQAGMADGSVHGVSSRISGATWWAACTPNGGEVLGNDW